MKVVKYLSCILLLLAGQSARGTAFTDTLIIEQGIVGNHYSAKWKNALAPRMTKAYLDSIAAIPVTINEKDKAWVELISTKTKRWNRFRDSLEMAFNDCHVPDTMYVLLGFAGGNDAFTFQYNTVCMDVSFLQKFYGDATLLENDERIDRLFAHEFTHLVHKQWRKKNNLSLVSFKDSILWECLYEGIGMYRSLNKKWFPKNGVIPDSTLPVLNKLYPQFVAMLTEVQTSANLSQADKDRIDAHLSNGPVTGKWGAFPVAIWLSLEANGDDKRLVYWTDKGLDAVLLLAKKYLDATNRMLFLQIKN